MEARLHSPDQPARELAHGDADPAVDLLARRLPVLLHGNLATLLVLVPLRRVRQPTGDDVRVPDGVHLEEPEPLDGGVEGGEDGVDHGSDVKRAHGLRHGGEVADVQLEDDGSPADHIEAHLVMDHLLGDVVGEQVDKDQPEPPELHLEELVEPPPQPLALVDDAGDRNGHEDGEDDLDDDLDPLRLGSLRRDVGDREEERSGADEHVVLEGDAARHGVDGDKDGAEEDEPAVHGDVEVCGQRAGTEGDLEQRDVRPLLPPHVVSPEEADDRQHG
eukprot:754969-Hanusia_phi.AAC.4